MRFDYSINSNLQVMRLHGKNTYLHIAPSYINKIYNLLKTLNNVKLSEIKPYRIKKYQRNRIGYLDKSQHQTFNYFLCAFFITRGCIDFH